MMVLCKIHCKSKVRRCRHTVPSKYNQVHSIYTGFLQPGMYWTSFLCQTTMMSSMYAYGLHGKHRRHLCISNDLFQTEKRKTEMTDRR